MALGTSEVEHGSSHQMIRVFALFAFLGNSPNFQLSVILCRKKTFTKNRASAAPRKPKIQGNLKGRKFERNLTARTL